MNKFASLLFVFAIIGAAYSAPAAEEAEGDDRILNGRKASRNEFPFICSLQYKMPSEPGTLLRSKFCGGSIINKRWILTAAHCIVNENTEGGVMHVNCGVTNAFDQTGQYIPVEKIMYPSGYNKTGGEEHDIAMLKLSKDLVFGPSVQPIALPKRGSKPTGRGKIIGWGAVNADHSKSSNELLAVDIDLVESRNCDIFRSHDSKCHLCLGGNGGGSACGGDSGGPFFKNENGRLTLYGATSFGGVKCTNDKPVVYTDIGYPGHYDFVMDAMAKN